MVDGRKVFCPRIISDGKSYERFDAFQELLKTLSRILHETMTFSGRDFPLNGEGICSGYSKVGGGRCEEHEEYEQQCTLQICRCTYMNAFHSSTMTGKLFSSEAMANAIFHGKFIFGEFY